MVVPSQFSSSTSRNDRPPPNVLRLAGRYGRPPETPVCMVASALGPPARRAWSWSRRASRPRRAPLSMYVTSARSLGRRATPADGSPPPPRSPFAARRRPTAPRRRRNASPPAIPPPLRSLSGSDEISSGQRAPGRMNASSSDVVAPARTELNNAGEDHGEADDRPSATTRQPELLPKRSVPSVTRNESR